MDTRRFSFFPNPVEDETVYSWLVRYHRMSGNRSFRRHTLPMSGVHQGRPANEFPGYLPQLAVAASYPLDNIVAQMTPYHYYGPFLSETLCIQLWEALVSGFVDAVHSQIGVVAGRLTPGRYLYSCRHCIREDIERYGFPFRHLSHQLLGVEVCPRHHEHLHPTSRTNIQALLPEPFSESVSNMAEERYASLIQQELSDKTLSLTAERVTAAYYRRLREHGLITQAGRVRERPLRNLLHSHLSFVPSEFGEYDYLRNQLTLHHYPENLFYQPSQAHHPLKHLVLIEVLFADWQDFKAQACLDVTDEHEPISCPPLSLHRAVLSEQAEKRLREGESLRKVSLSEGLSVSTLNILAHQKQIETDKRPSKVFPEIERAIWRKLVVGERTTDIAPQFGLSVGAIEQILRKHPELVTLRKRIWFYQSRTLHRAAILACMQEYLLAGRQQIRVVQGASYTWLYKHDQSWLYHNLSEAIPRQQRSKCSLASREKME